MDVPPGGTIITTLFWRRETLALTSKTVKIKPPPIFPSTMYTMLLVVTVRSESAGGDVNITPESWFTDDYWSSTSNESVLGKSYLEDAEADLISE